MLKVNLVSYNLKLHSVILEVILYSLLSCFNVFQMYLPSPSNCREKVRLTQENLNSSKLKYVLSKVF